MEADSFLQAVAEVIVDDVLFRHLLKFTSEEKMNMGINRSSHHENHDVSWWRVGFYMTSSNKRELFRRHLDNLSRGYPERSRTQCGLEYGRCRQHGGHHEHAHRDCIFMHRKTTLEPFCKATFASPSPCLWGRQGEAYRWQVISSTSSIVWKTP